MRIALATGLAAILGLAAAGSAPAQDAQDALKAKYAEKMAEPWISHGGWRTDYDKALEEAGKSGKLIFAYFSRSYAP